MTRKSSTPTQYEARRIQRELRQLEWKYVKARTTFQQIHIENELSWKMTRLASLMAIEKREARESREARSTHKEQ